MSLLRSQQLHSSSTRSYNMQQQEFSHKRLHRQNYITRKMSYRKDDCAMRPTYGCPENFQEFLSMPTATFLKVLNRLLFRLILWMCNQNLRFIALSIPEITGGTHKIWTVPACTPFSPKFLMGFYSDGPWMYQPNLKSVALPIPQIIVIAVLGRDCKHPILGRGGPRGWGWYRSKEHWWVPMGPSQ